MNPNDSAPFDPTPEGSFPQDLPLQGADQFDDQETMPAMDESSWLLEEEGASGDPDFEHASVHALPDVFAEPPAEGWLGEEEVPADAGGEEAAFEDDLVGASYVEPETSSHAFSKALLPGSIVLLLSFGSVGAWAFLKHSKDAPASDPVVAIAEAEVDVPEEEPEVELVKPEGVGNEPTGRMSYQRDGAVIPAEGYGTVAPVKATVDSPREPGELPPEDAAVEDAAPDGVEAPFEAMEIAEDGEPNDTSETNEGGELDIEVGTYVDSGETSLFEGGIENTEPFPNENGETRSDDLAQSEMPIESLSPAFLDEFVLNVEPLDDEAVAMLNAAEGDESVGLEDAGDPAVEVPVAPLPGDEVYSSMAWTYPSGNGTPMSPVATYFDQIDEAQDSGMDVAKAGSESSTDAGADEAEPSEMGPALAEDFMPFGFFDDDRASLDVEPDIRSLDVTEMSPITDSAPTQEEQTDAAPLDMASAGAEDNLTLGDWGPLELSLEPPFEALVEPIAPELAEAAPAPAEEPTVEPFDEPIEAESVASADEDPFIQTAEEPEAVDAPAVDLAQAPAAEEPVVDVPAVEEPQVPVEVTNLDVAAAETNGDAAEAPVEVPAEVSAEAPAEVVAEAPMEIPMEAPVQAIDMNDAHARLDAIFGPTPVEVLPVAPVEFPSEPIVAQESTDAPEETAPEMSDEFSAPETLAGADTTTDETELAPFEVAIGEEPIAIEDPEQGLELTDVAGEPEAPVEPTEVAPAELPEVATVEPSDSPVDVAVTELTEPDAAPEIIAETSAEDTGADVGELKIDPSSITGPAPIAPTVAMDEAPDGPSVEAEAEPKDVAVEVRPNLADEVRSPRRGSVLTRVGNGEIWPHRTVPKSKLKGDKFVLTPNVGQVRIVFDAGDSLDGRLHGVGDNKIALDTRLGRLTLDARRVDRLDRLGRNNQRSASGEVSTKGLEKVRVQADGGVFLGHLLSREGNRVTLLLSEGMRVTLESDDIRPAGRQKTVSRLRRPK